MAETWLLNETVTLQEQTFSIKFSSSGQNFNSFSSTKVNIFYDSTAVYDGKHIPGGGSHWHDEAYRTVTFETAPTGDLLTWLQANGTKQSNKLSVDLTTLSGWANLAPGNHTIKIVAKGTCYRDSEKSAGVEVTKAAEVYTDCLTFTGEDSEFTLKATNKDWDGTLEWSTNHNTWTTLAGTEEMQSVGKKLYLRGKWNNSFGRGSGIWWRLSAKAGCSGDIRTLFDWETKKMAPSYSNWCFDMFYGCTNLTTAPKLPATNLSQYCYREMFQGCTNLTTAPELPATTLEKGCYQSMFRGCTKLKINTSSGNKIFTCPTTIPEKAVADMFYNTGGTFTGTPTAGNTYYWTE